MFAQRHRTLFYWLLRMWDAQHTLHNIEHLQTWGNFTRNIQISHYLLFPLVHSHCHSYSHGYNTKIPFRGISMGIMWTWELRSLSRLCFKVASDLENCTGCWWREPRAFRGSPVEIEANFAGFPRKWNSSCDVTAEMKTRCTVMLLYWCSSSSWQVSPATSFKSHWAVSVPVSDADG